MVRTIFIALIVLALAGCASAPIAPVDARAIDRLWRDDAFSLDETQIRVGKRELFALDPELLSMLRSSGMREASTQRRVDYLMSLLYGPDLKSFRYAGDETHIAAETWRSKRGNCMSLSVLAYSMAKALNLDVQLQEVRVPPMFSRQQDIDFVGRHVNVLIKNQARLHLKNGTMTSGNVVMDFDPQVGWLRTGSELTEENVLSRYYNNIGADHFAKRDYPAAYMWFKAAVRADNRFASSYANLASLYKRKGITEGAEAMLLLAIALDGEDDSAIRNLHQLLVAQGRVDEAKTYAALIERRQERNPYYWLGQGVEYLRDAKYRQAVNALERAESLSTGFEEVHQYLAIAYWRAGYPTKARQQVAVLTALDPANPADPGFVRLRKKIGAPTRE